MNGQTELKLQGAAVEMQSSLIQIARQHNLTPSEFALVLSRLATQELERVFRYQEVAQENNTRHDQ